MPKISKSAVFNAAKISAGCAAAIVISTLLGVKYSATAGLITVLSIQNTKKETAEIALKRLLSFITAIITSFISFHFLGYTTMAFAIYLFVFILICGLFRAQSAIVPVSVLIAHILSEKQFSVQIVINEFLLLFIGAGVGFLLNLYLHKDTKKMAEYRAAVDDEIKAIIGRASWFFRIFFAKSLKICSCSITFKIDSIKKAGLKFNELFGAGAKYYMGEENIFLANALEKGLKIISIDVKIADVIQEESTWFGTFDRNYFQLRGAVYYELSHEHYKDLIYDFAERKRELYEKNLTYDEAIKAMFEGVEEYLSLKE